MKMIEAIKQRRSVKHYDTKHKMTEKEIEYQVVYDTRQYKKSKLARTAI